MPDEPAPAEQPDAAPAGAHPALRVIARLGPGAVAAAFVLVAPWVGIGLSLIYMDTIALWLAEREQVGVIIYVAAFAALSAVGALPTWLTAAAGGWAFGFRAGFPAALAGIVGGAAIGYAVGAWVSADRVAKLIDENPKARAVRDALIGGGGVGARWRMLGLVALVRLPATPFALTNLVMGSVRIPALPYILGTLFGIAPRTALLVFLGMTMVSLQDNISGVTPIWVKVAGFAAYFIVGGIVFTMGDRAVRKIARSAPGADTP